MCIIKVRIVSNGINIGIICDLKDGSKTNIREKKMSVSFCMMR